MRTISLALLTAGYALSFQATSGWIPDSQHPSVQYRFKCLREALSIDWRNSYPGAVSLKARVRGSNYDGDEQVVIPPGGTVTSSLETLYCTPESFQVTEKHFSMATPPPPAIASTKPGEAAKPAPPPPPTVAAWAPPAPLTEVPAGAFASIHVGMKRQELLARIGNPLSKLAIPEENELVEHYRYPVSPGKMAVVNLSNGVVTEVGAPQP
jgi:hypothetical protein